MRRRHRLTRALAAFDAATIATTHGFCLQMLAGLGMAGDLEPDATFVEDVDDLVVEVVGDLYVRRFAGASGEPAVDPRTALTVARSAIGDPGKLVQTDAPDGSSAQLRYVLAADTEKEVYRRKRMRRLIDYDDLVSRLDDALRDPVRGRRRAGPIAVQSRPRRRVPGHRPAAVADPGDRVPRRDDAGADRRSEAGYLRLPRSRPRHVPGGDRCGDFALHTRTQQA